MRNFNLSGALIAIFAVLIILGVTILFVAVQSSRVVTAENGSQFRLVESVKCFEPKPDAIGYNTYTYTKSVDGVVRIRVLPDITEIIMKDDDIKHHKKIRRIVYVHNGVAGCKYSNVWLEKGKEYRNE